MKSPKPSASNFSTCDMCSKPVARFEATCPLLTTGVEADLVGLRRVDTLETNLGCTNGEGIAVNNSGYAHEFDSIRAVSDEYHRRQRYEAQSHSSL
jgi:hypothetical protein